MILTFRHVYSSHRSRDEERISKPGAVSTPVKSSEDGVLSQASDQASSRDEKLLPPLPGTASLHTLCSFVSLRVFLHFSLVLVVAKSNVHV